MDTFKVTQALSEALDDLDDRLDLAEGVSDDLESLANDFDALREEFDEFKQLVLARLPKVEEIPERELGGVTPAESMVCGDKPPDQNSQN